ncbi:hypothetical protein RI367_003126 [Sorochytrium milnesiophthora]
MRTPDATGDVDAQWTAAGASSAALLGAKQFVEQAIARHAATLETPRPYNDDQCQGGSGVVSVMLRTRPILPEEVDRGQFAGVTVANPHTFVYKPTGGALTDMALETHNFNNVDASFGPDASAADVFAATAAPLLSFVEQGGLGVFVAFGQTGAGTDHFSVSVAFFEIFGDNVYDLLADRKPLRVFMIAGQPTVVQGATRIVVTDKESFQAAIACGNEYRQARATFKNSNSSRSHAVCAIQLSRKDEPSGDGAECLEITGHTLLLVDLAGSERNTDQLHHDAVRIKETQATNKSLLTLKECIRARHLHAIQKQSKHIHIPLRGSPLTMVLKDALDPDTKLDTRLLVLGHLSPSISEVQHTLNTARYVSNLKASSLSHGARAEAAARDDSRALSRKRASRPHPSQWTFFELSHQIATWSKYTIKLADIIQAPSLAPKGTSMIDRWLNQFDKTKTAEDNEPTLPPPWVQLSQMSRETWIQECAKQNVALQVATDVYEQYHKALAAARTMGTTNEEGVDILLLK